MRQTSMFNMLYFVCCPGTLLSCLGALSLAIGGHAEMALHEGSQLILEEDDTCTTADPSRARDCSFSAIQRIGTGVHRKQSMRPSKRPHVEVLDEDRWRNLHFLDLHCDRVVSENDRAQVAKALGRRVSEESMTNIVADRLLYCPPDGVADIPEAVFWAPARGPRLVQQWTNRLLVAPQLNFAFCSIEKVASRNSRQLMKALASLPPDEYPLAAGWWHSDLDSASIRREAGWSSGIFLRDPAERLLSAWMSKCVLQEDFGLNCLGSLVEENASKAEKVLSFELMVREALPKYHAVRRARGGSFNSHFDPQAIFCGGRGVDSYDFVGVLSNNASAVHSQVTRMLSDWAKIPPDSPIWEALKVNFPATEIAGHRTDSAGNMADFYRDPEVLSTVKEIYAVDYEFISLAVSREGR